MKRVAYTRFKQLDRWTGRVVKSRHMVPVDELPKGAEPIGTVEWRELPETPEEIDRARFEMHSGNRQKRSGD